MIIAIIIVGTSFKGCASSVFVNYPHYNHDDQDHDHRNQISLGLWILGATLIMIITTTIVTIYDYHDHEHNQISLGLCILGTGKLPWLNCLQNLHIVYRGSCPTGFQTFFDKYYFIVCLQVCFMHIIKIG